MSMRSRASRPNWEASAMVRSPLMIRALAFVGCSMLKASISCRTEIAGSSRVGIAYSRFHRHT